jgi:hypothetical protein
MIFDIVLSAVLFAVGLRFGGWWTVPLIALLWGSKVGALRAPGLRCAIGAGIAVLGWLAWDASTGPFGVLAKTVGGVLQIPPIAVLLVTIALPVLLAWAAGVVGATTLNRSRM